LGGLKLQDQGAMLIRLRSATTGQAGEWLRWLDNVV